MTCTTCENKNKCNTLTKKDYTLLLRQKDYKLNQLHQIEKNIWDYGDVIKEIRNNNWKYTIPVNVYGTIKHAPKKNVFDVFIKKPENVVYGWNLSILEKKKEDLLKCIRLLSAKELNFRRELYD